MIRTILFSSLFVFCLSIQESAAQRRERLISDPHDRAKKQTQIIDSICTLSGPQKQRIEKIQKDYADLTVELFNKKEGLSRDSIRNYMMQLNQQKLQDMNLILTQQQMQLWQEYTESQIIKSGRFRAH